MTARARKRIISYLKKNVMNARAAGAVAHSITASIHQKRGALKHLDEGLLAASEGGVIGIQRCQR